MTRLNKRGQLAIFIIIAIIIIAGALIFVFQDRVLPPEKSSEFSIIYEQYDSCIESEASAALSLAGSQGGRIDTGIFVPGSDYAPFSSHLNFLGFAVPYWYYISGNGVIKEQVPTKAQIEKEVADSVAAGIKNCNFENLYAQGYSIKFGEPNVKIKIEDAKVSADVTADILASKGENSAKKASHHVEIPSKFGKFYSAALKIYDKEKNEVFLEKYAEDILRLYAPVDGVEISCAPKIWKSRETADTIKSGLEANIAHLKTSGNDYTLAKEENRYFVINENLGENVNFVYSKEWPTKIEIFGSDGELLIAQPIGNQEGMGILGFCYAPYHFVYDIGFPVMVQIYDENEIFQFPIAVIIDKNLPRKAMLSEINPEESIDLCEYKTQDLEVNIYNTNFEKIDANISYSCFNQECKLGNSKEGVFFGKAPACVNGYLKLSSSGYADKRIIFSSNKENKAEVIMDEEVNVELELEVSGKPLAGNAIVSFGGERSISTSLPENPKIKISEGSYNISVYVYGNSSITIPASTKRQCTQVASSGVSGLLGGTKEQCFDINLPETKIDSAIIGGGSSEIYLIANDLKKGKLILKVDAFSAPDSLEKLQLNYEALEEAGVVVEAK
ncbi:MAG: hypothetical protein AABX07_05365 [Nanoarchaeota archaeon]